MPDFKLFTLQEAEQTLPLVRRPKPRSGCGEVGHRAC